jgi:2-dehydropantoate 2-reductase
LVNEAGNVRENRAEEGIFLLHRITGEGRGKMRILVLGAGAEGVRLPWKTADEYLQYLRNEQLAATAEHHSSMLQDISRGRRTEIDFLNGAVVRRGVSHAIPTPFNACITGLVRFRETLGRGGVPR